MSTNIRGGRIKTISMEKLMEKCREFDKKRIPFVKQLLRLKFITRFILMKDSAFLLKEEAVLFENLYGEFVEKVFRAAESKRVSSFDISFNVCFIPAGKYIYIMPFGARELKGFFENNFEFEEYDYWNNTDPKEGIDYKDWKKRGADWDKVLGGKGWAKPCDVGFVFEPDVRGQILGFNEDGKKTSFEIYEKYCPEQFGKELRARQFLSNNFPGIFYNYKPTWEDAFKMAVTIFGDDEFYTPEELVKVIENKLPDIDRSYFGEKEK